MPKVRNLHAVMSRLSMVNRGVMLVLTMEVPMTTKTARVKIALVTLSIVKIL